MARKHRFWQLQFLPCILNSHNSSIKCSTFAKKVVGVCSCEGWTGMKKRYTEAQISNALRSVVHRVPIFWLGREYKIELARFQGSGGKSSASSHQNQLIHFPKYWVREEDWHREHRCIGRLVYVSVIRGRRDCGLAVVHQQITAAGLPNEHAEVAYIRGCLRCLVDAGVPLGPVLAFVLKTLLRIRENE